MTHIPNDIADPVAITQADVETLQSRWPEEIRLRVAETTGTIADRLPLLIASAFPGVSEDDLQTVTTAGHLLANSIIVYDDLMDREEDSDLSVDPLRGQALQFEAYQLLYSVLDADSPFWPALRRLFVEYSEACLTEIAFVRSKMSWDDLSEDKLMDVGRKKSGLSKAAAVALQALSSTNEPVEPIQSSIENVYLAYQMLDDLSDWRGDLQRGFPSMLLRRVMTAHGHSTDLDMETWMLQTERRIYYGGHAQTMIERGQQALHMARTAVRGRNLPDWLKAIDGLDTKLNNLRQDLDRIAARNLHHANVQPQVVLEKPASTSAWQDMAWTGVESLVHRWKSGFPEARHVMRFRQDEGFTAPSDISRGDVFARAFIAEALGEFRPRTSAIDAVLQYETDYLMGKQDADPVGGWSYFPDLPELPPDADDLGQVLRVLLLAGREQEARQCATSPLQVIFEDRSYDHGGFETWIVPKEPSTPLQERRRAFMHSAWGMGCDADVVANLACTLSMAGWPDYQSHVEAAGRFLTAEQHEDGTWRTPWYHGPYYGIYVCVRALARIQPESGAISRAIAYVLDARRDDGSWGVEGEPGDSLNTALALLALSHAPPPTISAEELEQSRAFLQNQCDGLNGWGDTQWIRMNLDRAQNRLGTILSYGSRAVTTAFVIRAAQAVQRLRTSTMTPTTAPNTGAHQAIPR